MRYNRDVPVDLWWDAEDAEHIRSRSTCYPHAADIEPEWTLQAAADPARVVRDPDPQEQGGLHPAHRYSSGAGFVLTVIMDPQDSSGVTAWKTRGADLRNYLERKDTADD